MIPQAKTLITGFHGCPKTWGTVVQTIQGSAAGFRCMTAFGNWIAVACSDNVVRIYDAITGALRVSLEPTHPVKVLKGSLDGSVLFCLDRGDSISLWDIQTGRFIRRFSFTREVQDIAVSSKGRYLACGSPNGFLKVLEIADKLPVADVRVVSRVRHFCWLEPEERVVIVGRRAAHAWDVVAGTIVPIFKTTNLISGVVYSQELNLLAIIAKSPLGNTVIIIDPQTGTSSVSSGVQEELSCFTFSHTTRELVCGTGKGGLEVFNFSTWSWRHLKYPEKMTFISSLPSGIIVAVFVHSGIQLLSLDDGRASSLQTKSASGANVRFFDEGKIIAVIPTTHYHIRLLETSTMSNLSAVPSQGTFTYLFQAARSSSEEPDFDGPPDTTHFSIILSASLENRVVAYCFKERDNVRLALCHFDDGLPKWTVEMDQPPSVGGISPTGTRIVTVHSAKYGILICAWGTENGQAQARLESWSYSLPSDITFDTETRFYFHHHDYCDPYDFETLSIHDYAREPYSWAKPYTPHRIACRSRQPRTVKSGEGQCEVDSGREWVVSDSKRICWVPPGYISSAGSGYCWARPDTLLMAGEDGTLRTLTFGLEKLHL